MYVISARPTRTWSWPPAEGRATLVARAKALGIAKNVRFVDRFVGRVEMARWLQAADVFVTPYPNLGQIVSGTLSYAMGAGLAIVSTPYPYAPEVLAGGRGILVPGPAFPGETGPGPQGGARQRRAAGGPRPRGLRSGRRMVWSEIGAQYRQLFGRVGAAASVAERSRRPSGWPPSTPEPFGTIARDGR